MPSLVGQMKFLNGIANPGMAMYDPTELIARRMRMSWGVQRYRIVLRMYTCIVDDGPIRCSTPSLVRLTGKL